MAEIFKCNKSEIVLSEVERLVLKEEDAEFLKSLSRNVVLEAVKVRVQERHIDSKLQNPFLRLFVKPKSPTPIIDLLAELDEND